jgi:hypothetical protein
MPSYGAGNQESAVRDPEPSLPLPNDNPSVFELTGAHVAGRRLSRNFSEDGSVVSGELTEPPDHETNPRKRSLDVYDPFELTGTLVASRRLL